MKEPTIPLRRCSCGLTLSPHHVVRHAQMNQIVEADYKCASCGTAFRASPNRAGGGYFTGGMLVLFGGLSAYLALAHAWRLQATGAALVLFYLAFRSFRSAQRENKILAQYPVVNDGANPPG
jgi:hypothetical protein